MQPNQNNVTTVNGLVKQMQTLSTQLKTLILIINIDSAEQATTSYKLATA